MPNTTIHRIEETRMTQCIDEDMLDLWSPDYYDHVSDSTALKHNAIFLV